MMFSLLSFNTVLFPQNELYREFLDIISALGVSVKAVLGVRITLGLRQNWDIEILKY